MADIIATGTSGYASGALDTASTVTNNVTPLDAKHPNGCASAIIQIETILGTGTTLKGTLTDLASRLAVQMSSAGIIIPPGSFFPYGGVTAPSGYLLSGSDYSRSTYATLFGVVGTRFGVGNGSTTFGLHLDGRLVMAPGTVTTTEAGIDSGVTITPTNTFTVSVNATKWITGMPVVFALSSGTISGLTSNTTYYIIRVSSTTVSLATTLALAQAGTAISLTAKSSPIWTLTYTGATRSVGDMGGEDAHAINSTETLAHTHTGAISNSPGITAGGSSNNAFGQPTSSFGGNTAMNIHAPFIVSNYIFKT